MERDGQEMEANELPETVEYKRKDFSFPLKSEDRLLMESPVNGLSRFAPPCPTTSSMNEAETETDEKANHMLLRAKEQLARMSYENHKTNDIDQTQGGVVLHSKATGDNLVISNNTLSAAATRLKTSSRPGFSQFFVKKGIKGKGISRRDHDQPCVLGINSSATEPSSNGISLREWLKPGSRKENKVESLVIFRQIVKLVDSAHSQGQVLQDLRPSCFSLLSSSKVIYTGVSVENELESAVHNVSKRKRSLKQGMNASNCSRGAKQLKHDENMKPPGHKTEFTSPHGSRTEMRNVVGFHTTIKQHSKPIVNKHPFFNYDTSFAQSPSADIEVEERWFLEEDIKEAMRRQSLRKSSFFPRIQNEFPDAGEKWTHLEDPGTSIPNDISNLKSDANDRWLSKDIRQLEHVYFSMRSKIHSSETAASAGSDKDLLKNRDRNRDLINSANVICTLSFDRNEDYIATAGISKRIKIFEFDAFMNDSIDIHYPVVEMSNKSKISCVCWNNYINNYLASTDYDGVVQTWDAGTGQGLCQYNEHQKRAWSVDFSHLTDKFSSFSPHLLAFGSADYKVYCYDLRHARIPLCTLVSHEKAVSYVKFLDSNTLLSASTDKH
ncbi:Detected protein of confused Function [Hibiscus syriacus]|uniref:Detected protein of confused Function n=1 Tax=Hibiscus syriacus TaxID=106335 RepID=A0A6A3BXG8_HIBSY|nr:Detected protein of confused Function [Hibiscus syriacus]